ncbi:MAG TPA: ABC transporter permease, partial [Burkholderiaceae bacterium]|nr:ABC transporter permease [Burkholderiaceae bacterium]
MSTPAAELAVAPVTPTPETAPVRISLSPNQRAWARFKRNRLGYVSLWIL